MSKGKQRRLAFFLLGVVLAIMLYANNARAGLMGGVGNLMSPTNGTNPPSPIPGNALATEAGVPITTEAGVTLVTET